MVEQLSFELLKKIGNIEIRRYDSYVIAKVDSFGDGGFNILFQFISGKNTATSEIEMTAPVISQEIEMTAPVISERESIAFVMPKKYSLNTLPKPIDERIKIIEIPPRIIAALRFSGRWSNSLFNRKSKKLLETIKENNIKINGSIFSMRYSSPFTPWFLRRNEVAVEVSLK
jgi:effector-binding domain-containing protein